MSGPVRKESHKTFQTTRSHCDTLSLVRAIASGLNGGFIMVERHDKAERYLIKTLLGSLYCLRCRIECELRTSMTLRWEDSFRGHVLVAKETKGTWSNSFSLFIYLPLIKAIKFFCWWCLRQIFPNDNNPDIQ